MADVCVLPDPVGADPIGVLRAAVDAIVAVDPAVLARGDTVLGVLAELSRLESVACRQAAQFEAGLEWAGVGAQNASVWVTSRARCTRTAARRRLRLGRELARMPLVADAFAAGRITIGHVDALARMRGRGKTVLAAFIRDEATLVAWAETKKWTHFAHDLEQWFTEVDDEDADRRAAKNHDARRFHLSQSFQGNWFADGMFDPVSGEIVNRVLREIERELFESDWATAKQRLGRDPGPVDLPRTAPQRRVDALVEMATRAATAPMNGRRPRPLFTVLVGEAAFARTCELASATVLTPGTLARHLDGALVERIVFDGPDRVIAVGRQREFTGALRRAIAVRDRRCVHDFCDEPAERCQVDHIVPFTQGGETRQENGRLLCGFHNRRRNHHPDENPPTN